MSTATAYLETARLTLAAHHGEELAWIPASAVLKAEWGEAITTEQAKAILTDPSTTTFTGIFDEAYQVIENGMIASTGPAVTDIKSSDLPDAQRGDVILRNGTEQYSVQKVMSDGIVSKVLILSKHAH